MLEIAEYGTVEAHPALVEQVRPRLWNQLRLTPSRTPGASGWTIRADQYVGVARLQTGRRSVPLSIRPKLDVDVLFLAEYAFRKNKNHDAVTDHRLLADLAPVRMDPAACLIAWFLNDVERFFRRHMRRDYRLRRETLEGELKERLLLDEYAARSLGEGRPQDVPCEFPDLSVDTPVNRVLRGCVRYACAQIPLVANPDARAFLRRRGRQVLARFAAVPDSQLRRDTFIALRRSGFPSIYAGMVHRSEAFVSGTHLEREVGDTQTGAFLFSMNSLFQDALHRLLTGWGNGVLEDRRHSAIIETPEGKASSRSPVDPDYVLRGRDFTLILDAKYKNAYAKGPHQDFVAGNAAIRVHRSDIYQAVAYRAHDAYSSASCGLVFPVSLRPNDPYPPAHLVRGFGAPVHVLFVDVGPCAPQNLPHFYEALNQVAARQPRHNKLRHPRPTAPESNPAASVHAA